MGYAITRTGPQALIPRLLISSSLALFATTSADAGQSPGDFLKSESIAGPQEICIYGGIQDHVGLTVGVRQHCPDAIPTPPVSSTGASHVSQEAQIGLNSHVPTSRHAVPLVVPPEQLSEIRSQYEASHVRQQIAFTAATINARGNDTDELFGLLKLWGEDQARLTEVFAVVQQQRVWLDAQADELLELRRQLADARFVTP